MQRFEQGQIIQFWVVADGDDGAANVSGEGADHVVWHARQQVDPGNIPACRVLRARVAQRNAETVEQGHGGEVLGQCAGTDQQQAVAWAEGAEHALAIEAEQFRQARGAEAGFAASQVQVTAYQACAVEAGQQLFKMLQRRGELQHQFEGTSTGQAEAVGLVGTDAIAHDLGLAGGHAGAFVCTGVAMDEVVLDAAPGNTADHSTVTAQGHHRADRARG